MSISLEAPVVRAKSERHSSLSPAQIMEIARAREASLSRLLMAYISSGLVFMLLPGTFLGVWNLLQISGRESTASISPAWIQAHGPAPYDRMYSSRFQRGSRISGICKLGWSVLPVSALLELTGITAFAMNIFGTFILEPSHGQKQPLVVGIN